MQETTKVTGFDMARPEVRNSRQTALSRWRKI